MESNTWCPLLDGADDFVRVGGPREWLRVGAGLSDEAVDGDLEIDDGAEDTRFSNRRRLSLGKNPSTALSKEHDVGVKWKTKRGWRSSQARMLGCL
jgi:hypothetical protein